MPRHTDGPRRRALEAAYRRRRRSLMLDLRELGMTEAAIAALYGWSAADVGLELDVARLDRPIYGPALPAYGGDVP